MSIIPSYALHRVFVKFNYNILYGQDQGIHSNFSVSKSNLLYLNLNLLADFNEVTERYKLTAVVAEVTSSIFITSLTKCQSNKVSKVPYGVVSFQIFLSTPSLVTLTPSSTSDHVKYMQ